MPPRPSPRPVLDAIRAVVVLAAVVATLVIGFTTSWLAGVVVGVLLVWAAVKLSGLWGSGDEEAGEGADLDRPGSVRSAIRLPLREPGHSWPRTAPASEAVLHADGYCTNCGPGADALRLWQAGAAASAVASEPSPPCPCVEARRGEQLAVAHDLPPETPRLADPTFFRKVPCDACEDEKRRRETEAVATFGHDGEGRDEGDGADEAPW